MPNHRKSRRDSTRPSSDRSFNATTSTTASSGRDGKPATEIQPRRVIGNLSPLVC
jgi:hypothetical protein